MNVFEGGFLGLDNIGVFDRSQPLPGGGHIEQSDGTSWMAMYCLKMLAIAIELAQQDIAYEDVASKFFEHFVYIGDAMADMGGSGKGLWDDQDGFYYDVLHLPNGVHWPLKVRSMVGLIPLFAVETFEPEDVEHLPGFMRRMQWFLDHHPDISNHVDMSRRSDRGIRRLLAVMNRQAADAAVGAAAHVHVVRDIRVVIEEPLHAAHESRQMLDVFGLERLDGEKRNQAHHRANFQRPVHSIGQMENVVVEAILRPTDLFRSHPDRSWRPDVDEVLEELAGDILVSGVMLGQLQGDRQHVEAVHAHPTRAV